MVKENGMRGTKYNKVVGVKNMSHEYRIGRCSNWYVGVDRDTCKFIVTHVSENGKCSMNTATIRRLKSILPSELDSAFTERIEQLWYEMDTAYQRKGLRFTENLTELK